MVYRPFDDVPFELLSYILSLVWLSDTREDSPARFLLPSVLIQVDRRFYHTTLATNILWSYLQITKVADLGHLRVRSQRSGSLLLDLCLKLANTSYQDVGEIIDEMVVLGPSHFRKITILGRTPPTEQHDHPASVNLLPLFGSSLRSLNLTNCSSIWSPTSLPETLETLSIREDYGEERIRAFQVFQCLNGFLCQSLRSLSLGGIFMDEDVDLPRECVLGSLEELELERLDLDDLVILLDVIRSPELRHLALKDIYYQPLPEDFILTWRALRFPNLRKLTIQAFQSNDNLLVSLLRNLPRSVRHLAITRAPPRFLDCFLKDLEDPWTTRFFRWLRHIVADGVPVCVLARIVGGRCPKLRTLQARFRTALHARGLLAEEKFVASFNVLAQSANEFKLLKDGDGSDATALVPLSLEQVANIVPRCSCCVLEGLHVVDTNSTTGNVLGAGS